MDSSTRELRTRLLRYMVDCNGGLDHTFIRKLIARNITGLYLIDKDIKTGKVVDNPHSLLFDFCVDYFKTYEYTPTDTVINVELAEASELDPFIKKNVIDLLVELNDYEPVESEFNFILDQVINIFVKSSTMAVLHASINKLDTTEPVPAITYLQKNLAELHAIAEKTDEDRGPKFIWQVANQFIERLENDAPLLGPTIPYGFNQLDMMLGGLAAGELLVLTGGMNVGKSFMGAEIAYTNAFEYGNRVVLANLEMDQDQVMARLISRQTGLPSRKIRREDFDKQEKELILASLEDLSEKNTNQRLVLFDIDQCITPAILERNLDLIYGDDYPDLIVLDYLDEMMPDKDTGQLWTNIESIVRSLKRMCRRKRTRMITMTQLNAKGINNTNANMTHVSFKSIGKVADTMLLLVEDPDNPYVGPEPGEYIGTPGNIIVRVIRARNEAKNVETRLCVEFATTSIRQGNMYEPSRKAKATRLMRDE